MNAKIDISNVRLESPRLLLRSFCDSDLDDFFEYASYPGVGEMAGWPHHETKAITRLVLDDFIKSKNQFAIVYKPNNKVIGSIGIEHYNEDIYSLVNHLNGRELGYVISFDYWNKGIATEASNLVIDYLFNELQLDFVTVSHFVTNDRSRSVIMKCGFAYFTTKDYIDRAGYDSKKQAIYYIKRNTKYKLEVCCGSYEDAINAYLGGARRIELNSALYLGGLTPTTKTLELIKKKTNLEVVSMVRPRATGFCYTPYEMEELFYNAMGLLEAGSDGLAFGFLNSDGSIDKKNTKKMVDLIHMFKREAVFHRAIDVSNDYLNNIGILADLGVDRVLTSGCRSQAPNGVELIKKAEELYGKRITILAGSGINITNAEALLDEANIYEIHSSCKDYLYDNTSKYGDVSYDYYADSKYEHVDETKVRSLANLILVK